MGEDVTSGFVHMGWVVGWLDMSTLGRLVGECIYDLFVT
jgi:hypothetical protein